jgi:hypothetical protein
MPLNFHWRAAALAYAVMSVVGACKGDEGPAGPVQTGSFTGFVVLHDEFGGRTSTAAGVVVSANPSGPAAATDSNGYYALDPVTTGAYTLVYSHPGYGTYSRPGMAFVGGTQYMGSTDIGAIATGSITGFAMADTGNKISMNGTATPPPSGAARAIRVFIDPSPSVSPTRYLVHWGFTTRTTGFAAALGPAELQTIRAAAGSGNTAYAVAYVDSFYSNAYVDTVSGRQLFPNLSPNHSDVVPFTVP